MLSIWITSFGRNPKIPEQEETQKLLDTFNYDIVKRAFRDGVLDGCKKLKTLIERINEKGEYIPFENSKKQETTIKLNRA